MLLSSEPHHVPSPGCRPSDACCGVCGPQALADEPAYQGAPLQPGRLVCQVCERTRSHALLLPAELWSDRVNSGTSAFHYSVVAG